MIDRFKDYLLGFAGAILIAIGYSSSYAVWRTSYPAQRVEACDINEWYVELPTGITSAFFKPAIVVEQELIRRDTTIRVGRTE